MRVIAIAAVADNGIIGSGQDMLWHLPGDWRRFKQVTMGHRLILGRATYEQIGQLPGRRITVVTRNPQWRPPAGGEVAVGVAEAVRVAADAGEGVCYVGGGAQIYAEAFRTGVLTDLDITAVHQAPDQGVRFPPIDPTAWTRVKAEPQDGYDFCFYVPVLRGRHVRLQALPGASWEPTGLGVWQVFQADADQPPIGHVTWLDGRVHITGMLDAVASAEATHLVQARVRAVGVGG